MSSSIKRLMIAHFFGNLYFVGPIMILFLLAKGLLLSQVLILSSVLTITSILFEIPTGVVADRFGRKWSMVGGTAVWALAWGLWFYTNSFPGYIAIYSLFGLASALWSGADEALIYDELKTDKQEHLAQKVFARYFAIAAISGAIGALIGGLLTPVHNLQAYYLPYRLYFAAIVLSLLTMLTVRERPHSTEGNKRAHQAENTWSQFSAGWIKLKSNPKLMRIVLFTLVTSSVALLDLFQPYFTQSHVSPQWFGYALSISSFLMAITKWYSYKIEEWFGVERGMIITAAIPALLWITMSIAFSPILAVILFITNDAIGNARDPILADYRNRHITGANRATVLSTISLLDSSYFAIMFPIMGFVAQHSLSSAFLLMGIVILAGLMFFRVRTEDVVAVK